MSESQIIQLTISKDYVSNWKVWEAIREILQNARDSVNFEVSYSEDLMSISTFNGAIDKKYLILGNSTKRDDINTIGTYGEGFKLALLVLLREGKKVTIHNGKDIWIPFFDKHNELDHECLNIKVIENALPEKEEVNFLIENLTEEEISLIKENSLYEQNIYIEAQYDGSYCWHPKTTPKVYVGGLYVCDLNKKYKMSYNFHPSILQLDRDRKSVCTFSLSYQATRMITLSGNYDLLSYLAESQAEDISDYYSFETPIYSYGNESVISPSDELKSVVSESFIKKHGELAYPINSEWDDKTKRIKTLKSVEAGYIPVVIKPGYYKMLNKALQNKKLEDFKFNLNEEILNFFEKNKKHLRSKAKKELEQIVKMIKVVEGEDLPEHVKNKIVIDKPTHNVNNELVDDIPF